MDRKSVDLPTGVEFVGPSIRIRFSWNKKRCCETLPFPQTAKGIAAAASLRAQVKQLDKLGALTPQKYAELFPGTRSAEVQGMPIFFDYAQDWLDSLQIVESTRKNYRSTLQNYWVPYLADKPLDMVTPVLMRKVVNSIEWTSPVRRKNAIRLVTTIFTQAVRDELISRNPAASIPPTRVTKRDLDPFTRPEADLMIAKLYELTSGLQQIYAIFLSSLSTPECGRGKPWRYAGQKLICARKQRVFAGSASTERFKSGLRRRLLAKFYGTIAR